MVVFAHVCTCVLIEFDLHHVSVSVFASVNVFRYESDRHTTTSFSNFRRYFFDVWCSVNVTTNQVLALCG